MVLQALEFSDCFLDSPWFRSGIKEHEDELEKTNTQIKLLIKVWKMPRIMQFISSAHSMVPRSFQNDSYSNVNHSLLKLKPQCLG